jgi:hypothetical protein
MVLKTNGMAFIKMQECLKIEFVPQRLSTVKVSEYREVTRCML